MMRRNIDDTTVSTTSRRRTHTGQRSLMAVDLAANLMAWGTAFLVLGPIVTPRRSVLAEVALTLGLTAVGMTVAWLSGLYSGHAGRERTSTALRTLRVLVIITLAAALAGVAFNLGAKELGPGLVLLWLLVLLGRAFVNARLRLRRAAGRDHDRVLIVGANHEAQQFLRLLELYPELGLDPVGVVGNAAQASLKGLESLFCGSLRSAARCARELDARYVVVMTGAVPPGRLQEVLDDLRESGVELILSADLGLLHQRSLTPRPLAFAPMFRVGDDTRIAQRRLKRAIDVVVAVLALVVLAPLAILAAIAVKLGDRGPVFYRQTRLGAHGAEFATLRFRTMRPNASHPSLRAQKHAVWRDPRMTRVGRLLEVTGINEVPLLWNVLRGEMSLVGPKPGYPALDADIRPLSMAPGLTGIWRTEANLFPATAARHEIDDLYMENWSLTLDVGILVSTIELVMIRLIRGASWRHAAGRSRAADEPIAPQSAGVMQGVA